jgi:Cu-processing system permease protein
MKKIIKYVMADILRNKLVLTYTIFLFTISMTVFNLEDNSAKGLLSLLNIILIIVPLVSIIFSTIYAYNSSEFIELLVSQPIKRKAIWLSLFSGLASALALAFLIGAGIPILLYQFNPTGLMMLVTGILLSVIFVAIAMLAAVRIRDKAKGIGAAIMLWLYFALLFDGLVLFLIFQFSDYPIEKTLVGISAFNPVDLARILILLKMDISALMGYTGAIFKNIFGTTAGISAAFFILFLWIAAPLYLSNRRFNRKDL